eukprot:474529-Hanusia_phi.AAC.2
MPGLLSRPARVSVAGHAAGLPEPCVSWRPPQCTHDVYPCQDLSLAEAAPRARGPGSGAGRRLTAPG